ncbi:ABC transporter ATP-binding protein [Polluticoccus soli]|uniref:ABC transporter ATP-binding protein n=1 Tax=Polluticoccus soli TaxID=3034150 RepID=UPI0023E0CDDD|nr:ATP-binding cassette domain-containing protein [Flavipsychrobacter sp. JY13-12]
MKTQVNLDDEQKEIILSIRDLHKSFDDSVVLNGIGLELHKGENAVIMGRSGVGKSVLIKIIAGLLKADRGMIKVFGRELQQLNDKELAEMRLKMGFLFQHGALYDSLTVRENIEFPLVRNVPHLHQRQVDERVNDALEAVGLPDTADRYPAELSGGEAKRIAIARMLILKPEIVLYDEPTSELDPLTCIEIINLINEVKKRYGASSIIITHDMTCAKQTGDKILMLIDGRFERQGKFDEVFDTDNEVIRGFYNYNFIQ